MQRHQTETISEKERGDKKAMCVELKEYIDEERRKKKKKKRVREREKERKKKKKRKFGL